MQILTHKIISLFLVVFCTLSAICAQDSSDRYTVYGTIKTADGKPAEYISVSLKNTVYGAYTDPDGCFSFNAPVGEYVMVVSSINAHRQEFPVKVAAGNNHLPDIEIIESTQDLEQIVVTGQLSPQSMRNSVYKVRVINNRQIEQKAANNLQSLLNTEIGVRLSNDMALGETDFEIMGMSGNNVKVLLDGIPVVDRGATKQSLSQVDINAIERVEIVEGPMSVIYGTDALAGVINIITKKPEIVTDKNSLRVSAGFQEESVGKEYDFFNKKGVHRENIQLGWSGKMGLYADAAFTRNTTGGWKGDKEGRELTWQPKDQYSYNGTLGYKKEGLNVWYRLDYLDEEIKNPENPNANTPEMLPDKSYLTNRMNHQLQSDWKISDRVTLNLAASYQDYERRTKTWFTDAVTGRKWLSLEESSQDTTRMKLAFARATVTWKALSNLTFQPGVDYNWNKGSGGRIDDFPVISELAAYLSAEWNATPWMDIRPGIRSILNSDYNAPAAIPTLLTKFTLREDMDLRASYAYGFRSPTLQELYFYFHNANHNIDGNPDLKAENSNNITLSYTWRILHGGNVRLTSTLTGFYNAFRNQITITEDANNNTHYTYNNLEKYKTLGGTWENALAWRNLGVNVGASLIGRYNRYSDYEEYADQGLPEFRYSPEVSASVMYRLASSGTDFSLFYKFTGSRDTYTYDSDIQNVSRRSAGAYHWADFNVTQRVWKYMSVSAGVKNIFDVTTVKNRYTNDFNDAQSISYSLIGCGRSYFLGMNFHFNK